MWGCTNNHRLQLLSSEYIGHNTNPWTKFIEHLPPTSTAEQMDSKTNLLACAANPTRTPYTSMHPTVLHMYMSTHDYMWICTVWLLVHVYTWQIWQAPKLNLPRIYFACPRLCIPWNLQLRANPTGVGTPSPHAATNGLLCTCGLRLACFGVHNSAGS